MEVMWRKNRNGEYLGRGGGGVGVGVSRFPGGICLFSLMNHFRVDGEQLLRGLSEHKDGGGPAAIRTLRGALTEAAGFPDCG